MVAPPRPLMIDPVSSTTLRGLRPGDRALLYDPNEGTFRQVIVEDLVGEEAHVSTLLKPPGFSARQVHRYMARGRDQFPNPWGSRSPTYM